MPSPGPVRPRRIQLALSDPRHFPVALETLGKMSANAQELVTKIGSRLTEATTDPRETAFLFQRLSIVVQRFNAACLADTVPISESAPCPFQPFLADRTK